MDSAMNAVTQFANRFCRSAWSSRRFRYTGFACVALTAGWLTYAGYGSHLGGPDAAAVAAGQILFEHEWTPDDPLAGGDGLGPVFNAKSCTECHFQGGVGGAGPNKHNVTSFQVHSNRRHHDVKKGVVHGFSLDEEFAQTKNTVKQVHPIVPGGVRVINGCSTVIEDFDPVAFMEVNTPPLFGMGLMDRLSESDIRSHMNARSRKLVAAEFVGDFSGTPVGRLRILDDGEVGKFGWKAQSPSLEHFVAEACAVELGLSNPLRRQDSPCHHCEDETAPLDMTGAQLNQLVAFVGTLPTPEQILPEDAQDLKVAHKGETAFNNIGCADCHPKSLGSVEGLYSDMLLHRIEDGTPDGSYRREEPEVPLPDEVPRQVEWKTPPLWGVADSAPYFHDGQSPTLEAAVLRHAGDARDVTKRFRSLPEEDRRAVISFLKTLKAPADALPANQEAAALEPDNGKDEAE